MLTKVEMYLRNDIRMKDDDGLLVATYWRDVLGESYKEMSAYDLLKLVAYNKLPKASNIERARRKVQELNPGLRGKNYKIKKELEKDFRININK